jgi:hypothetical protein
VSKMSKMSKMVSYCIPIMNRIDDIKSSLLWNLSIAKKFNNVEIIIHCFDDNNEAKDWVYKTFKSEIKSGLLIFRSKQPLKDWHFSIAKNSFKNEINGNFYSSLDGDNYITEAEVSNTLSVIEEFNEKCFMHHWSGQWGDGSSGRITIPRSLYERFGYIDSIFPRQFDEIGLLLACAKQNDMNFITGSDKNFIKVSNLCQEFVEKNKLEIDIHKRSIASSKAPENPKDDGYINSDNKLKFYHDFNSLFTLYKLSSTSSASNYYLDMLKGKQENIAHDDVVNRLFEYVFNGTMPNLAASSELTVYSVIKDDGAFLQSWYEHYKKCGVKRFILIDDGSKTPLGDKLNYDDVYVFTPKLGDFKSSKIFWLSTIIKVFQKYNSYCLTVDSDEMVDLPKGLQTFQQLFKMYPEHDFFLGRMIEMMPRTIEEEINRNNFVSKMNYCYSRPMNDDHDYKNYGSIKWAFGKHWYCSFEVDFRFRYFGTYDCLRKYPIIKWEKGVWFNQGFHALRQNRREVNIKNSFSDKKLILNVKHYKMYKVLAEDFDKNASINLTSNYHDRTGANIKKLFSDKNFKYLKAWNHSPFKISYDRFI